MEIKNMLEEFHKKNKIDFYAFIEILSGHIENIYVPCFKDGGMHGVPVFYNPIGRVNKGFKIKEYHWDDTKKEFQRSLGTGRYHRITIADLLRGKDYYGQEFFWFKTREEAELFAQLY